MTIKQFSGNVPQETLCKAGINAIRSYRAIYKQDPPKKTEGEFVVFDYPDCFLKRLGVIFRRMKIGTPTLRIVPTKKRKKILPKKVFSTKK